MGFISGIMSLIFSPFKKVIKVTIAFNLIKKKKKFGRVWVLKLLFLTLLLWFGFIFFFGHYEVCTSSANGNDPHVLLWTHGCELIIGIFSKRWDKQVRKTVLLQDVNQNLWHTSAQTPSSSTWEQKRLIQRGFDRTQTLTGRCRLTGTWLWKHCFIVLIVFYLLFSKFV